MERKISIGTDRRQDMNDGDGIQRMRYGEYSPIQVWEASSANKSLMRTLQNASWSSLARKQEIAEVVVHLLLCHENCIFSRPIWNGGRERPGSNYSTLWYATGATTTITGRNGLNLRHGSRKTRLTCNIRIYIGMSVSYKRKGHCAINSAVVGNCMHARQRHACLHCYTV